MCGSLLDDGSLFSALEHEVFELTELDILNQALISAALHFQVIEFFYGFFIFCFVLFYHHAIVSSSRFLYFIYF
jgi:hypothetical protein